MLSSHCSLAALPSCRQVELAVAAAKGYRIYNLRQSISNVSGGMLQTLFGQQSTAYMLQLLLLHACAHRRCRC